jgi:3-phenylpropionate/trans-cinnamate dioxygenase ferredoxin subunit
MSLAFVKVTEPGDPKPGKMKRVLVAGKKILLANVDGRYYAVDDTCTHEDASLSTGSLKGDCVKCPLHGSRFHLATGAALDEPASVNLTTYAVRQEGDGIYIGLAGGTP